VARLIVEALNADLLSGPGETILLFFCVSVSRADDGTPVTGLHERNFRVASWTGPYTDYQVEMWKDEWQWEPYDKEPSGCYMLLVRITTPDRPLDRFQEGLHYFFAIQARTYSFNKVLGGELPVIADHGQTILNVRNLPGPVVTSM
jgi:hypothetical protein